VVLVVLEVLAVRVNVDAERRRCPVLLAGCVRKPPSYAKRCRAACRSSAGVRHAARVRPAVAQLCVPVPG